MTLGLEHLQILVFIVGPGICALQIARVHASQVVPVVKNLSANAGDVREMDLIHGSRRSPGGGHGNPL